MNAIVNPNGSRATAAMLRAVPVRNRLVRSEERVGQALVLRTPVRRSWYMRRPLSWILPFSESRAVELDRLGAEVWERCDGVSNAETIIEEFAERHRLSFHEARLSVMEFLRHLVQRGFLVIEGSVEPEALP